MRSIEERANAHYPKQREFKATYRNGLIDGKRDGYIRGATEQRAIDIDRMITYVENMPQDVTRQEMIEGLIKAMEK